MEAIGVDVLRLVPDEQGIEVDEDGPLGANHRPDRRIRLDDRVVGDTPVPLGARLQRSGRRQRCGEYVSHVARRLFGMSNTVSIAELDTLHRVAAYGCRGGS